MKPTSISTNHTAATPSDLSFSEMTSPPQQSQLPAPKHLTTDQIDALASTVFSKPRLTGRSVVIPLGKHAFRLGHLKPLLDDDDQREQVEIASSSLGGGGDNSNSNPKTKTRIQVSTTIAKEWLDSHSSSSSTTSAATKSTSSSSTSSTPASPPPPANRGSGGFVNIQEEYNPQGKRVEGTVYDVSSQLDRIWKHAEETGLPQDEEDVVVIPEEDPQPNISDQEYESLSKRLDELARLEEQAGDEPPTFPRRRKKKTPTTTMTKGSSFGGWSKGFLNNNNNNSGGGSKKNKKKATPTPSQPSSSASSSSSSGEPKRQRGVVIDTTKNSVQEIPRIGTQKIPPKPQRAAGPSSLEATSMFSGVVQERSSSSTITKQEQPQHQTPSPRSGGGIVERTGGSSIVDTRSGGGIGERGPSVVASSNRRQPTTTPTAAAPRKRVSRFAQERQHQQQGR
jgi:hypothetical protein